VQSALLYNMSTVCVVWGCRSSWSLVQSQNSMHV